MQKIKIINDPVFGLIRISDELFSQILDHTYFQRLRRIKQLGLTSMVFPGATHSRWLHSLGAYHLMSKALDVLKLKGVAISNDEDKAAKMAILLHDIGHGPFSHSLEHTLIDHVSHESISLAYMQAMNEELNGGLDLAIKIFKNDYERTFFHQLMSGHLDVDRLDYLRRDSYFTGVSEGNIGSDRIVNMLNVLNDELVVEKKGMHSIENFLIARRMMYWQVYYHKTVLVAEQMLIHILQRAKELVKKGIKLYASTELMFFLDNELKVSDFNNRKVLNNFARLDDTDVTVSIKHWSNHSDKILSNLCGQLIERNLFKIELSNFEISAERIKELKHKVADYYQINFEETAFFVNHGKVSHMLYDNHLDKIKILETDQKALDIADASFNSSLSVNADTVERHFLYYPKNLVHSL